MKRAFFSLFVVPLVLTISTGCEWGERPFDSPFRGIIPAADENASEDTSPEEEPKDTVDPIKMMAIRPAYQVITGAGKTVPLSLDVWLWDSTTFLDMTDRLWLPGSGEPTILTWTTENFGIAAVDPTGMVTSVSSGETLIHVWIGDRSAVARIIVEVPPSLAPNIDVTDLPPDLPNDEPPHDDPSDDPSIDITDRPPPSPPAPSPAPAPEETEPEEPPVTEAPPPSPDAPYADAVISYKKGTNGGSGEENLPEIVLGPPKGRGPFQGSSDIFSLGVGGEIVLEFIDYRIFDGEGADFIVFENAFQVGSNPENTFAEPATIGVSNDGVHFIEFPCDPLARPYPGCAGVRPVLANPDANDIDPTDPSVSGGDPFDLSDAGLTTARFVRIRDAGTGYGPIGPDTGGFDLDAVAIVHGTLP